jgi:hypothetical protein
MIKMTFLVRYELVVTEKKILNQAMFRKENFSGRF